MKTLVNALPPFPGFVFQDIRLPRHRDGQPSRIEIAVEPHGGLPAKCSRCRQPAPGYDRLPQRSGLFVPLGGIRTVCLFSARRGQCATPGVVVEDVPWSAGKRPGPLAMMCFLSRWARRLSWRETARAFHPSWECVDRSGEWFVQRGLAHRKLEGVESIGVDASHWGNSQRADNFLTGIYQIDSHCRRRLWVGQRRPQATLRRGLAALGGEVVSGLRFGCSDMWRPYLTVIAAQAGPAVHVLDRFHIPSHLNQALDQVRRAEGGQLRAAGLAAAERLKNMRWKLRRRGRRVRGRARRELSRRLNSKLVTARAWALKDRFEHFWSYQSLRCAGDFLEYWTWRARRSRLEPMKQVARMRRSQENLLLNWFRAKGEISSGAVAGLNNKIRVVTRRSDGFRT